MPNTERESRTEREAESLERSLRILNIAEKKARIYSRLLTETALAKAMETLACRHEEQKAALQTLLYGKADKKNKKNEQKAQGMDGEK